VFQFAEGAVTVSNPGIAVPGNQQGTTQYSMININANTQSGSSSVNPMAGHADGEDIRPKNLSARLWLRVT
jgi:hypothetical protein